MEHEYQERFRQVGLKIGYYRRLRGYTQEQFAEVLEVSNSFYSQIEAPNVHKPISLRTLFRIAEALKVEPCKLLERD